MFLTLFPISIAVMFNKCAPICLAKTLWIQLWCFLNLIVSVAFKVLVKRFLVVGKHPVLSILFHFPLSLALFTHYFQLLVQYLYNCIIFFVPNFVLSLKPQTGRPLSASHHFYSVLVRSHLLFAMFRLCMIGSGIFFIITLLIKIVVDVSLLLLSW